MAKPAAGATAAPTPSPTPAVALHRYAIAHVIATDLRIRTVPTTGPDSRCFTPSLQPGDRIFVADGPAFADGYTWYEVKALFDGTRRGPLGWVAVAARSGKP